MNKNAIKKYAVAARRKLMESITQKMRYYGFEEKHGLNEKEILQKLANDGVYLDESQKKARSALSSRIHAHGYQIVVEEVAYTWFNRLVALRFMEVNGYLPSGIRILSNSDVNRLEPECIRSWERLEFINKAQAEKAKAQGDEVLYRHILVRQCNELGKLMPGMFSTISDYAELLLPDRLYTKDGIVYDLTHSEITEADFGEQVEIIGWLYQYYISEKKDEVFAALKKNVKITKENVPAATQLFTPDWIVRYMVENSLGRLWLEGHPDNELLSDWKYYLPDAEQTPEVEAEIDKIRRITRNIRPEEIKLIDPCMGSGHILVYAFDVLYQIYLKQGYAERDIPDLILRNNLFGLDIDERACQLTYFALMMKARFYNRRFFRRDPKDIPQPQVYATVLDSEIAVYRRNMGDFLLDKTLKTNHQETLDYLITAFQDIEEYGSLIKLENRDYKGLLEAWENYAAATTSDFNLSLWFVAMEKAVPEMIKRAILLTQKYDVVVTNPPYMGASGMGGKLAEFVKKEYPDSKSDLFAAFIERGLVLIKPNGYNCMVTMQSWMFLSSFETMRKKILASQTLVNLMHMENMVMGIAFGTAVANLRGKHITGYNGQYNHIKMSDIINDLPLVFPPVSNRNVSTSSDYFAKIPGSPVAYWASTNMINAFASSDSIATIAPPKQGLATADNDRFLRMWYEVWFSKIGFGIESCELSEESKCKWFPYNKGGSYRRWFGNREYVVNWEHNGIEIKNFRDENGKVRSRPQNLLFYFKPAITWSDLTSGSFSGRYCEEGFMFDIKGSSGFPTVDKMQYTIGLLNSKLSQAFIDILNPTVTTQVGDMSRIPVIMNYVKKPYIDKLVDECIKIAQFDWNSFEISWDFKRHPMIHGVYGTKLPLESNILTDEMMEGAFQAWERECDERFQTLKRNEEELNRIFIDIYGLQDELTPEVEDKDVTVRLANKEREIRSFISYAVGCMFGRYSLDVEGLAYAGGAWDASKYTSYIPEADNILPITDADYFNDDIVVRFIEFVRVVYGKEWLENNLYFIAETLYPNANGSARDKIRRYFLNDFYKDHMKIYQKKPIYWQFDSGKQNGFKALIYLHRYDKHTVGRVRMEYLHPLQRKYEAEIERLNELANLPTTSARDKADSGKRVEILRKKIAECREYDHIIAHIAVQSIELDLDDGVTANYAKFQGIEIAQGDGRLPVKMDLLGRI